jgi:hypothetical protein
MKYCVLLPFRVKTSGGELELQPGQIVALASEKAFSLISTGKIQPVEKVAYKVFSELLGCYLWVTETSEDIAALRTQGVKEAIYSSKEIEKLKTLDQQSLKIVNDIKTIIEDGVIEEVEKNKGESDDN